ncbi:DUF2155 domain-containing protein [Phenylobacterium sp. J426]|uniref:DUF2155 domain-containing protein n=1 Tax=Phenylobacterium sp. J426 TaxID=2898439 RepID=UPI0021516C82|nr:DUF2155 domain-containing protein [Phenylobacterium sp. J426]MCR5875545.1 DUF2155 domain-containing protein [Phenylobacterium sp. J426]
MARRPAASAILKRTVSAVAAGAVLAGGLVAAQPIPPPTNLPQEAAPPGGEEPRALAIPTPEPLAPPPVETQEAEPAPAPKAQVAEKPAEAPTRRARYDVAVIQALDKVTAETLKFEAPVGRPVRWKGLIFTVRACERSAPDEPVEDSIVYLTIDSQPRPQPGRPTPPPRQAFKGWMYASSPGLHALEHATYDAWVISCRAAAPVAGAPSAPQR